MKSSFINKNNTFIRFLAVGVLNTLFGYSMFALFIYLGLHYALAVYFSTMLGILFNFKTIGTLVFKNKNNGLLLKFILVYATIYLLNIFCLWLFEINGYYNMYINGFLLLMPLAIVSYILNKTFVFKG